jgi:queuine tRNA-ribosyltransferase
MKGCAASADALTEIGFDGYAIGGLAVGEGQEAMFATLDFAPDMLPAGPPALPDGRGQARRSGRRGGARGRHVRLRAAEPFGPQRAGFTWNGPLNLRNARHAEDQAPLDERCALPTCGTYSRAYLHHLTKAGEILGAMLMTGRIREAIGSGRFADFAAGFRARYSAGK